MTKRKKGKRICSLIQRSAAKAIKDAPPEDREAVVAEIERQRDALLEKNGCQ